MSETILKGKHNLFIGSSLLSIFLFQKELFSSFFFGLNEQFYSNEVLLINYPKIGLRNGLLIFFLVILVGILFRNSPNSWKSTPLPIQWLIKVLVIVLIWSFSFYEYNYYFDQWHIIDRMAVILFGLASILNPIFVIFFVFEVAIISNQFSFPDCFSYSYTDKKIIFDILLTFWLFTIFRLRISKIPWHLFTITVFAIIGNWYLLAGIGKLGIDWHSNNHLSKLFLASVRHGWLSGFDNLVDIIHNFTVKYDPILTYGTYLVEIILPLLLILKRKLTIAILVIFIFFHISIFVSSGIFFWKWIITEIVLILVIVISYRHNFFTLRNYLIYVICLLVAPLFYSNLKLSWLDSGIINYYSFYLKSGSDELIKLDASFFSPYDLVFAQNRFFFHTDRHHLSNTYGSNFNQEAVELINKSEVMTNPFFDSLRNVYGKNDFDVTKAAKFELFLNKFITNKLDNDRKLISYLDPPMHITQGQNQQNFDQLQTLGESPGELIMIYQEEQLFNIGKNKVFYSDTTSIKLKCAE